MTRRTESRLCTRRIGAGQWATWGNIKTDRHRRDWVIYALGLGLLAVLVFRSPFAPRLAPRNNVIDRMEAAGAVSPTTQVPTKTTDARLLPTTVIAPPTITAAPSVTDVLTTTSTIQLVEPPDVVQARGAEAWRLVAFDLARLPGWDVVFLPARSGFRGRTVPGQKRVEIYVRPEDSVRSVAYTLAHELGHAVDVTYSTPALRRAYRRLRAIPSSSPWFGCIDCSDYATPAGDFAETFGYMVTDEGFDWRSMLGPPPTNEQVAGITALYGL